MLQFQKENFSWQQLLAFTVAALAIIIGFWKIEYVFPLLFAYWIIIGINNFLQLPEKQVLPIFHWADYALLLLLLIEIVSYAYSIYSPNSLFQVEKILYFSFLFYTLRIVFQYKKLSQLLVTGLAVYGSALALWAFFVFLMLQTRLRLEGWSDASQFKSLFSPFGLLNNEWATLSICFLAFPLTVTAIFRFSRSLLTLSIIGFALVNAGTLVTFSRGAYVSLAFFWLIAFGLIGYFKMLHPRAMILTILASGILTLIFILPGFPALTTTLAMNKTMSQQRSTHGRLEIFERSTCLVKDYIWLGAGGNNYPIINDRCKDKDEDQGYSGFTNNTYLQILLEKGVLGLLAYALFFIGLVAAYWRSVIQQGAKNEQLITCLLFGGLLTFFVRELFFSTLFYSPGAMTMLAVLAAGGFTDNILVSKKKNGLWIFLWSLLVLASCLVFYQKWKFQQAEKQANIAISLAQSENIKAAKEKIARAIALQPQVAPYHALQGFMIGQVNASMPQIMADSVVINESDLNQATEAYNAAIRLNPFDSGYWFNLGWLQFLANREAQPALNNIEKALALDPNMIEYLVGAGNMLECLSDTTVAFAKYERAIRLDPELLDTPFYKNLQKRQPERAEALVNKVVNDLQTRLDTAYNTLIAARLAKLLLNQGQTDTAKKWLLRVISELPAMNRPYFYLAIIYRQEGKQKEAFDLLQKSATLDEKDYLVNIALGDIYAQRESSQRGALLGSADYYTQALRRWLDWHTAHSVKSDLKYQHYVGFRNDLIVRDLTYSCRPDLDVRGLLSKIAALYERLNNKKLAEYYKKLENQNLELLTPSDIIQ